MTSLMKKGEDVGSSQAKRMEKRVPDKNNCLDKDLEVRENLVHLEN